jgi:hypothetical protein
MNKTNQPGTDAVAAGAGARFLAALPARYRPDQATVTRLAPKVEQLLAGDWSWDSLRRRLLAGVESEHSPTAAVIRRVEGLAGERPKGAPPPARPLWCGGCDEHTRLRENDAGQPYRCPQCHPRAVSA